MNTKKSTAKGTGKTNSKAAELQTESPISEKDEVKNAEKRTAKLQKSASKKQ